MRIRQLGSTVGHPDEKQNLTTFVINDTVAIDAGSLGYWTPLSNQQQIRHVFLTHSHLDHVGSLPIFIDNVYQSESESPTLYGSQHVLDTLKTDIFNDRLWPNLLRIAPPNAPFFKIQELLPEQPVEVGGLKFTPVPVNHVVPTLGIVVEDARSAVIFVGDTGPTDRIWEVANKLPHLKAIFVECSFPNRLEGLAMQSQHLSPRLLAQELRKLNSKPQVIAVHLKPAHHSSIVSELQNLGIPHLQFGGSHQHWDFEGVAPP